MLPRSSRQQLRLSLMRLARTQHGYFTAAQAHELGYSYQAQKFHVDHGNWIRLERALFRIVEWPIADDDHLVRWSLWSGGVGTVSHESALAAHGLGDVNPSRLHLSVPPGFRRHTENVVVVLHHQVIEDDDIEEREGHRVTTPARAIVESARDGLARELVDGAVSEARERGMVSRRTLQRVAARLCPDAEIGAVRALQEIGQ